MNHIPNPFLGGDMQQPKQPQTPPGPGFLVMTRPPSGSNSYGWRGGNRGGHFSPSPRASPHHPGSFIPFSARGSNNNQDSGGRGGRFNQGGGRGQVSPRMYSPYQPSPGRSGGQWSMGSPGRNQGMPFTPTRHGGNRDSYGSHRQNRPNSGGGSRGGRDRGPISDIPIEKFVSPSMVKDPWAEFDLQVTQVSRPSERGSAFPSLDNSEIVIDSDTSVVVENSCEGSVSITDDRDGSPVPDTGSDSTNIATSSTSDKEGGSDSAGDD